MPNLADIASLLHIPAPAGAEKITITGLATLEEATPTELSLVGSEAFLKALQNTNAAAVIVNRKVRLPQGVRPATLIVDDADLAMSQVLSMYAPPIQRPPVGIDPTARIAPGAQIGPDAAIGPYVVIGERTKIGAGSMIHPGVIIGSDVIIGEKCELFPNVVLRERITLGNRVIIHAGSVIGSDGFGYRWDGRQHAKIPQIGTVIIEDDVEIGSCVCVDRAKFSATRIGAGSKIDNLVQVAHNVTMGRHCILVGQAGLAGSVHLGNGVVLGGQCAVRDHITLADGAMIGACSGVAEDVEPKQVVSGLPALPHRQTLREQAALRRLPDLVTQVRKLQEEVQALKAKS